MKSKRILCVTLIVLTLLITGCHSFKYVRNYNAKGMKGTEVYCWRVNNISWRCVALYGTNRAKDYSEIKGLDNMFFSCSLFEMKNILATFNEEERNAVAIWVVDYPFPNKGIVEILPREDNIEMYAYLYFRLNLK
ncbi:MAG: hypothetical protein J1F31_02485 [Erysipelotrichales bacterium]|nr:hypothetical protein [Erysipelotrichales bacterium]